MPNNVTDIGCITTLDIPPDKVLDRAVGNLEQVCVIGTTNDGDFYFASSKADGGEVLWLLQLAIHKLMKIGDQEKP